jgi:hypothetical protein
MAMAYCRECTTRISDTAAKCPHCGYQRDDGQPITISNELLPARSGISLVSPEITSLGDRSTLEEIATSPDFRFIFNDSERLLKVFPYLQDVLKNLTGKKLLVADIPQNLQRLIDSGKLKLNMSKKGEILAQIVDRDSKFAHTVRLKEIQTSPALDNAVINLQTQFALAQILHEIGVVQDGIKNLHIELQDDRLALADSAVEQLQQARSIIDSRVRDQKLQIVSGKATDARNQLTRFFSRTQTQLQKRASQNDLQKIRSSNAKKSSDLSNEALESLSAILKTVQVEAICYLSMGELSAASTTVRQFQTFIADHELENRDVLLEINSFSQDDRAEFIDTFLRATRSVTKFELSSTGSTSAVTEEEDKHGKDK